MRVVYLYTCGYKKPKAQAPLGVPIRHTSLIYIHARTLLFVACYITSECPLGACSVSVVTDTSLEAAPRYIIIRE
jgi:hypothetical protein